MRTEDGLIPPLEIDPSAARPLYQQLYRSLRTAIEKGRLAPGLRLPSTRSLAGDLGVSRTTAIQAYRQLKLEGYIESDERSGTFVADTPPLAVARQDSPEPEPSRQPRTSPSLSARGEHILRSGHEAFEDGPPRPFTPGVPALDVFPRRLWRRVQSEVSHLVGRHLGPADPAGHPWLRSLIARYLAATRAIDCTADQILITSGAQEAFSILSELLLDPGDTVLMEDPSYRAAKRTFAESGARIVDVPVDRNGMDVERGLHLAPGAQLVYVTPSHQFPLGWPLSVDRQLALLRWARTRGGWIIEDGYDSEYRFQGGPLPALLSLEGARACTIFVGTFKRIIFPALALGFVVVPERLVAPFVSLRNRRLRSMPITPQLTLAAFMHDGHFTRHVLRMRTLYAERGGALAEALRQDLSPHMEVEPPRAGMHLLAWLPAGVHDREVSARASRGGVEAPALSHFGSTPFRRGGLILGFGAVAASEARSWVGKLAEAVLPLDGVPTPIS